MAVEPPVLIRSELPESKNPAMRADFAAMPPELQSRMLGLLQKADPENFAWWQNLLLRCEA